MWIKRLHNFYLNKSCALANNADEIQDNGHGFIPSYISETNIEGISVLHDNQSLKRPQFS